MGVEEEIRNLLDIFQQPTWCLIQECSITPRSANSNSPKFSVVQESLLAARLLPFTVVRD
jgi:hypothetical protein